MPQSLRERGFVATPPAPAASQPVVEAPASAASAPEMAAAPAEAASAPVAVDPLRPEATVDLNDAAARADLWARVRRGFAMADLDSVSCASASSGTPPVRLRAAHDRTR